MKNAQGRKPGTNDKRAYRKPVLTNYGELRTMTLDASQEGLIYDLDRGEYVYEVEKGGRQE